MYGYVQNTLSPVEKCLKDSGLSKNNIHDVVLVGVLQESKIQQLLSDLFNGKELSKSINPDKLSHTVLPFRPQFSPERVPKTDSLLLLDVAPLSLGLETSGEVMTTIIPRNTTIHKNHKRFYVFR